MGWGDMKIAYLVNQYPKGSHTFIRREIAALEMRGVDVLRFSVRGSSEELHDPLDRAEKGRTQVILGKGVKGLLRGLVRSAFLQPVKLSAAAKLAIQLGWTSESGVGKHLAYLGEACVLKAWLDEERPDHLHAHFGSNSTTVALLLRELGGPEFSFTAHGPEEFDKPGLISLGEKIRRARHVFGISSFGRSQLYRQVDRSHWAKIGIMRCGVDDQFLRDEPTPVPDTKKLVSVGRINEQKGQLLMIEAVAQLKQRGQDFELVLLGDGEMREALEERIRDLDIGDRVKILGWASGEEVRRHLLEARALVLPSFAEGLPVVIMEALALGRPVLTTYIAGIPELVGNGECGWLVPAGSLPELVDAMELVLSTGVERLTEMGAEGRRRVLQFHDASKNVSALLDALGVELPSETVA
jgi:colanic acid/amylovoran biosynthesis glycosyltransferase